MVLIKLKKDVNGSEYKVDPIVISKMNPDDVCGGEIAPVPYCNTVMVAETGSGKSSVLKDLLLRCVGSALVVAFVPTIDSDPTWLYIRKKLEERGNQFIGFSTLETTVSDSESEVSDDFSMEEFDEIVVSSTDEKTKSTKIKKINHLKELTKCFLKYPMLNDPKCSSGKICPRIVVVMDDMREYLKHPSVAEFMSISRHCKAKFIISTQGIHDLPPVALRQVRQWFIFRGFPKEKVEKIRKDAGIALDLETFQKIYTHATREPFSFLLINKNGNDFDYWSTFLHQYEFSD